MLCPKCQSSLPDDSRFCHYCGIDIKQFEAENPKEINPEGKTEMQPEEKTKAAVAGEKKYFKGLIASLIACVVLVGVTIWLGTSQSATIKHQEEKISALEASNSTLQNSLNQKTDQFNRAQESLKAEKEKVNKYKPGYDEFNTITSFMRSQGRFYNKYKDYYCNTNFLVLSKGETADIKVTCTRYTTIYWARDNANISCQWGDWSGYSLPLTITANKVGTSVITLTNDKNSETLYVLVVVI